jgi:AcrR family transcriptional regulator
VARRANVSHGLIYRWFDSKAGLLAAVVEDFYDRQDEAIIDTDPAPEATTWADREKARTHKAVAFHYDDPLAATVLSTLTKEPSIAAIEQRRLNRQIEEATKNLRTAQANDEVPQDIDPELVGAMILGGTREVLRHALGRSKRPNPQAVVDELWRFVVAAVRFRPQPS